MLTKRLTNVLSRSRAILVIRNRLYLHTAQIPDAVTFQPLTQGTYNASIIAMEKKRKYEFDKAKKQRPRKLAKVKPNTFLPEGSNEEILAIEVADLLSKAAQPDANGSSETPGEHSESQRSAEIGQEIELDIVALSSTGDGLAYNETKTHIFVVPFSVPGDRVLAKPWTWLGKYTNADFIKVVRPASSRDGVTPPCPYFARCSGCQFQMLPYDKQLEHKRGIVQRAFKNFSGLSMGQMPEVESTMGSPLQYGYRTKLTPHFTGPPNWEKRHEKPDWKEVPNIGFNMKGRRTVMDIEKCPIGTDILQEGLKIERQKVTDTISTYKNGATILLRESTQRLYKEMGKDGIVTDVVNNGISTSSEAPGTMPSNVKDQMLESSSLIPVTESSQGASPTIKLEYPTHTDLKTYTSDNEALATEYITTTIDPTTEPPTTKTYQFTNTAGSFFQNNNSILGPFTSYVYSKCMPTSPASDSKPIKYLLDAYCGSGLFTLTLSSHFTSSLGIDIDGRGISRARLNASRNAVTNAGFIDADASALFADVPYPADQTVVVIDPPRKGCDREFLRQLRKYGPRRIIYVSCNVHTQARDVGILVNGFRRDSQGRYSGSTEVELDANWEEAGLKKYAIESIRGFDFFPQTGHVEGVCVLNEIPGFQ